MSAAGGPDARPARRAPDTVPAVLATTVERFGDRPAIVDGEVRLSYAELADAARRFGAALVVAGVTPGARVAIWAPNGPRWVVAALGIFGTGAVLVPVNTRFKGAEAAHVLARSGARVLVTVTDFLDTDYVALLHADDTELPALDTIVVASGPVPGGTMSWDDFVSRADSDALTEAAGRAAAVTTDDVSDILFTSGTTGAPKGVVQTHGRTLNVAKDWVAMTGLAETDRYLMVNPYFHMFGLKAGILAATCAGATMYPLAVFDVDRVLFLVSDEQITVLPGPPTLYQGLLDHPDRGGHDLSTLRVAVTGAADIPVELICRIHDELPFSVVVTGYGLTEAGTATGTGPGDDVETIATTVGRPRPGFELRVVDADGDDVPAGDAGEVLLRGGSVLARYLDDPEATAAALSPEGWLRTGDLGVVEPNGCLRIVGRSKDMYIVGGFNAYPAEIENLLGAHPLISQASVIGVPDERLGEVGMAFVVLRQGSGALAGSSAFGGGVPAGGGAGTAGIRDEIIAWSRDHMANYKVPRFVVVLDELPVNATGKVEKLTLRGMAQEHLGERMGKRA